MPPGPVPARSWYRARAAWLGKQGVEQDAVGGDRGVLVCLAQDGGGGVVGDDGQVGAVARQHDAGAAEVGGERGGVAVPGERVEDDGGGAFHALQLVGGADQHVRQVREQGTYGGGLGD